jgi:hypothetical protein
VGRAQPVLKLVGAVILAATLLLAGYAVGALSTDASDTPAGRMIYGEVSEVRASSRVVCIRAEADVCAQLFRGELPAQGVQVRGWLVALPYDSDEGDEDLIWAFVTVMGSG